MEASSWLNALKENETRPMDLEDDGYRLDAAERLRVSKSIQAFQLGECSEGASLRSNAERLGDPDYAAAIKLLIREENMHSAYLTSFMRDQQIPKLEKQWTATWFRRLKNLAGLNLRLRVLITAEIVALSYYESLGRSTRSQKLKRICDRMLEDETLHVAFQMHHIQAFNRKTLTPRFNDIVHLLFSMVTALVVWTEHRAVLKMSASAYIARVTRDFTRVLEDAHRPRRRTSARFL